MYFLNNHCPREPHCGTAAIPTPFVVVFVVVLVVAALAMSDYDNDNGHRRHRDNRDGTQTYGPLLGRDDQP
jgi:hypothetical protein